MGTALRGRRRDFSKRSAAWNSGTLSTKRARIRRSWNRTVKTRSALAGSRFIAPSRMDRARQSLAAVLAEPLAPHVVERIFPNFSWPPLPVLDELRALLHSYDPNVSGTIRRFQRQASLRFPLHAAGMQFIFSFGRACEFVPLVCVSMRACSHASEVACRLDKAVATRQCQHAHHIRGALTFPKCAAQVPDQNGNTPLHIACEHGRCAPADTYRRTRV